MTSRSSDRKHVHEFQVISHTEDWMKVLVNCHDISCNYTIVLTTPKRGGAKPNTTGMRHLCCG